MTEMIVSEHWRELPVVRGNDVIRRLWPIIEGRGLIAGSFAAYACSRELPPWKPNDVDIFGTKQGDTLALAYHIAAQVGMRITAQSDVAWTLEASGAIPVQVVKPSPSWGVYPDDLLNSFDMDVCRAVIIRPAAVLADENAGRYSAKVLRTSNALRSLRRVLKYHKRGVEFSDHELLKLFRAWESMPAERRAEMLETARREMLDDEALDYQLDDDEWFEGE